MRDNFTSLYFTMHRLPFKDAFRNAVSLNSKNMVILECLLRARQCMILPQMYLRWYCEKVWNASRRMGWEVQKDGNTLPYD